MYRSYYSYSDMPQMKKQNETSKCNEQNQQICKKPATKCRDNGLFGNIETDDVILGIVILALLLDNGGDNLLLIVLAIIFLSGQN